MTVCKGISVCSGCALASCRILPKLPRFDLHERTAAPAEQSMQAVRRAMEEFRADITGAAAAHTDGTACEALAEVQLAMMEDECFLEGIEAALKAGYTPQASVLQAALQQEQMLRELNDVYMSARAEDVHDLGMRLACRLVGASYPSLVGLTDDCIVVAHDLLPSMLMTAALEHVRGIAVETSTRTSHASILASGLEIPTVVACGGATSAESGEPVFLDADAGTFSCALSESEQVSAVEKERAWQTERTQLQQYIDTQPLTEDGVRIEVHANIVEPMVLERALGRGIDGVGLFRTEFLYMNRAKLPSEEEQYHIYSYAARKLNGLPLTIRTMDIGGDKKVDYLDLPQEENPFLGYRAIRICLDRPEIFLPQLRAILRAGADGTVLIMFPMIAQRSELIAARAALEQAKAQLREAGIPYGVETKIGIMVEIPSAVLLLEQMAGLVDFVSIGSNDLTQYTYAADRMNSRIASLCDFLDPAVLCLISHTIAVSDAHGIACSLCGEMAGDGLGLAALAALGIHKLSVSPSKVLKTKKRLTMLNAAGLQAAAKEILRAGDSGEVRRILQSHLPKGYPIEP
ncbi:MAG: phosphoenolpyruvate--protein phosphotransferase [Lawsonibacter sp.]|nr:phosphoenolpyruvate--protein phosphotransferase [Lawsonibacter sp.]